MCLTPFACACLKLFDPENSELRSRQTQQLAAIDVRNNLPLNNYCHPV